jgi:hypothetical protein
MTQYSGIRCRAWRRALIPPSNDRLDAETSTTKRISSGLGFANVFDATSYTASRYQHDVGLEENVFRKLQRGLVRDKQIVRRCATEDTIQQEPDLVMPDVFGRRHDEIPLNQLETLVFPQDASLHHAADVIDREWTSAEAVVWLVRAIFIV